MGFGKRGVTPLPRPSASLPPEDGGAVADLRALRHVTAQSNSSGALVGIALTVLGIIAGVGAALLHSSW